MFMICVNEINECENLNLCSADFQELKFMAREHPITRANFFLYFNLQSFGKFYKRNDILEKKIIAFWSARSNFILIHLKFSRSFTHCVI